VRDWVIVGQQQQLQSRRALPPTDVTSITWSQWLGFFEAYQTAFGTAELCWLASAMQPAACTPLRPGDRAATSDITEWLDAAEAMAQKRHTWNIDGLDVSISTAGADSDAAAAIPGPDRSLEWYAHLQGTRRAIVLALVARSPLMPHAVFIPERGLPLPGGHYRADGNASVLQKLEPFSSSGAAAVWDEPQPPIGYSVAPSATYYGGADGAVTLPAGGAPPPRRTWVV
jgi:hypothetical protein